MKFISYINSKDLLLKRLHKYEQICKMLLGIQEKSLRFHVIAKHGMFPMISKWNSRGHQANRLASWCWACNGFQIDEILVDLSEPKISWCQAYNHISTQH